MRKSAGITRPATEAHLKKCSKPYLKRARTFWGFRLSAEDSETVSSAIRSSGLSISQFLRDAVLHHAKMVLSGRIARD